MLNGIGSSTLTTRRLSAGAALVAIAFGLLFAGGAFAQGIPTATLTGRVFNDTLDLPGVMVTAKAATLQGTRTTATGASGDYVFANVPPGDYTITFTLSGFKTQTLTITLGASQQQRLDANMSMTAVSTTATVSAQSDSISQSPAQATTYTGDLLAKLPTGRTVTSAVILSPGVNQNGPNGVSVSGAQSTENLYTVNGVVITDNVRSTANSLFIEDAIQETTTTTSTVSAEYGRFTGGVINTITKSGGNQFSGSFRTTFTNDSWQSTSGYRVPATGANPQEGSFVNKAVPTFEATLGGPIMKDKVWFFGAGRFFDTSDAVSSLTKFTNIPYTNGAKETRYEGKLTLSPFQSHTITGSYIGIKHDDVNYSFASSIPIGDLASIYNRQLPQELLAVNYNGVLTNSFFIEGQYSRRKFTFENAGGSFQDPVKGTVIRDLANNISYNSPIFCGVCGPTNRDNDNYVAKGTYFLSTQNLGSHNVVLGYDNFGGQMKSNNYQSGSNFVIYTFGSIVQGQNIYPILSPDASTEIDYWPVLQQSQGSDLRTQSVYLNDTWRLSNRLSFNVGVRYDKNDATDAAGNVTSKDSAFSPRLAATFDVKGDGSLRVTGSYAKYVAALQETQAGSGATLAGSPADFYWYYDGPGINTGATGPYLSSNAATQQLINWFQAGGCLPNPLAAGCTIPQGGAPSIGGVNVQIQGSLASPSTKEYVLGIAGNFGSSSRGSFRADMVRREYTDYYDLKKDMTTGQVTSPFGARQDLGLIVNSSDYRREYTGLHTQFSYRVGSRLTLGGNWTWSHLIGNLVGETSGSGPIRGGDHVYPEYFNTAWENPVGDLSQDQRHRVRLYGTYDVPIPVSFGVFNISAIQQIDTGTPYGAVGAVDSRAFVTNPGYLTRPASVPYYYTARDAFRTPNVYRTDIQLNFAHRIAGGLEVFVAPQVFNVFNAQHVVSVNTGVETRLTNAASYAAFNPFTTVPTQGARGTGANWNYGPLFGQPTSSTSYQTPRFFQVSVGLRF